MAQKVPAFSRRVTSPAYTGNAALLYVFPTNMITLTTEEAVGVFQGISLQTTPSSVTIDFFLSDPTPFLPAEQFHYDASSGTWVSGTGSQDAWKAYDQATAEKTRVLLESMHQFTIPTNSNLLGLSNDLVALEDYKWVAIRVAYATDPAADVYVQITPQVIPESIGARKAVIV